MINFGETKKEPVNTDVQLLKQLVKEGYDIIGVRHSASNYTDNKGNVKTLVEKSPYNGNGGSMKGWEKMTHDELVKTLNFNYKGYGLRTGLQGNKKYLMTLDFDCFDKKTQTDAKQCIEWKNQWVSYGILDGAFDSSTVGNMNVIVDYTAIDSLMEILKGKKQICGLEMLVDNTSQQVVPPTMTTDKISGLKLQARKWRSEKPIFVLTEEHTDHIEFIKSCYTYNDVKVKVNAKVKPVINEVINEVIETINNDTNLINSYTDLLIHGLNMHMDDFNDYLKIRECLKSNGFPQSVFNQWVALIGSNDEHHIGLWDARCKYDMISIYTLDNICKRVNAPFYKQWVHKWKLVNEKLNTDDDNNNSVLYKQFDTIFDMNSLNSFNDGALADAFKLAYGERFIYCNKRVFHFNGVYWKPDNGDKSNICNFIDGVFCKLMMSYLKHKMNYWTNQLDGDDEDSKRVLSKIAECKKFCDVVLSKLRNSKTRNCMVSDVCNKICNEEQQWNLNPYMFCFENCCIDITTGLKVNGCASDYINMSCGYDYNDDYDNNLVIELDELINSIQPDKKVKDYLLQVLSTCLVSEQIQSFFILTGKGGNGKSVLVELLMEMLGSYSYILPSGFISKIIKDGGNPEASNMDCKRVVIISEPESKEPLCCATVKKITGDTKINVRPLYSNQTGIDMKNTSIMVCNEKPQLDELNDAISRRMSHCVIPFSQKFVCEVEYNNISDEERTQFNVKLGNVKYVGQAFKNDYKQALFMVLLPYFRHYQKALFSDVPSIVVNESKAYIKGCDNIYEWFEENYELANEVVFIEDLFMEYKSGDEYYQLSKEDKRKNGTCKKFKEVLQSNLFIRKYYKEARQCYNKKQYSKPFIAGWKRKNVPSMFDDVDSNASTILY